MDRSPGPLARARLRWGLPDIAVAWFAGVIGATLLVTPFYEPGKDTSRQSIWVLFAAAVLQNLGWILALGVVSHLKGQRSLSRDFGLGLSRGVESLRTFGTWLAAGVAVAVAGIALTLPLKVLGNYDGGVQDVVKALERAGGAGRLLFALSVVTIVPLGEELLFRGGIQRALQRRFRAEIAVFATAAIFAASHVVGDPGSYPAVPVLLLVGLVSGYQAYHTGDLTRSIAIHSGYNLLAALTLVLR